MRISTFHQTVICFFSPFKSKIAFLGGGNVRYFYLLWLVHTYVLQDIAAPSPTPSRHPRRGRHSLRRRRPGQTLPSYTPLTEQLLMLTPLVIFFNLIYIIVKPSRSESFHLLLSTAFSATTGLLVIILDCTLPWPRTRTPVTTPLIQIFKVPYHHQSFTSVTPRLRLFLKDRTSWSFATDQFYVKPLKKIFLSYMYSF